MSLAFSTQRKGRREEEVGPARCSSVTPQVVLQGWTPQVMLLGILWSQGELAGRGAWLWCAGAWHRTWNAISTWRMSAGMGVAGGCSVTAAWQVVALAEMLR